MSRPNTFGNFASLGWSKPLLLGSALLLLPALVSAGDKDKDKSSKHDKGTPARVTDAGKSADTRTMTTTGQTSHMKQDSSAHFAKDFDQKTDFGPVKSLGQQGRSRSPEANSFPVSPGANGPDIRTVSTDKKVNGGKAKSDDSSP